MISKLSDLTAQRKMRLSLTLIAIKTATFFRDIITYMLNSTLGVILASDKNPKSKPVKEYIKEHDLMIVTELSIRN